MRLELHLSMQSVVYIKKKQKLSGFRKTSGRLILCFWPNIFLGCCHTTTKKMNNKNSDGSKNFAHLNTNTVSVALAIANQLNSISILRILILFSSVCFFSCWFLFVCSVVLNACLYWHISLPSLSLLLSLCVCSIDLRIESNGSVES